MRSVQLPILSCTTRAIPRLSRLELVSLEPYTTYQRSTVSALHGTRLTQYALIGFSLQQYGSTELFVTFDIVSVVHHRRASLQS